MRLVSMRSLSVVDHLLAAHALGLADDLVQLLLVLSDQAVEIALGLLEPRGLAHANQQKEQDHGAEPAADRVEERHAEDLELAASSHGQSSDGASIEPPVRIASEPIGRRRLRVAFHREQNAY